MIVLSARLSLQIREISRRILLEIMRNGLRSIGPISVVSTAERVGKMERQQSPLRRIIIIV